MANVFANDDARLIYILHQISQHVFTFLWILLLCCSDALPHLSRRIKIGALLLCEVHLLIGWLQLRFGLTVRGAPLQWCVNAELLLFKILLFMVFRFYPSVINFSNKFFCNLFKNIHNIYIVTSLSGVWLHNILVVVCLPIVFVLHRW